MPGSRSTRCCLNRQRDCARVEPAPASACGVSTATPRVFAQHFLANAYEALAPNRRLGVVVRCIDALDSHQQEQLPENSAARTFLSIFARDHDARARLGFVVVVGRKSGELSTDFKSTFKAARYVRVSVLSEDNARELIFMRSAIAHCSLISTRLSASCRSRPGIRISRS